VMKMEVIPWNTGKPSLRSFTIPVGRGAIADKLQSYR